MRLHYKYDLGRYLIFYFMQLPYLVWKGSERMGSMARLQP